MGSQHENHFFNLERRSDRERSMHTTHTSRSRSRGGSHFSHEKNTKDMQWEIDHLKRKLRHERRRRTSSISNFSSDDEEDGSYRKRSKTPSSESFSYDEDYHHERRNRSSSSKCLGNDVMSRHSTKFPNHLSHTELKEGNFLGGSFSPCSPCIMAE